MPFIIVGRATRYDYDKVLQWVAERDAARSKVSVQNTKRAKVLTSPTITAAEKKDSISVNILDELMSVSYTDAMRRENIPFEALSLEQLKSLFNFWWNFDSIITSRKQFIEDMKKSHKMIRESMEYSDELLSGRQKQEWDKIRKEIENRYK
jgi:hypothetical protein